MTSELIILEAEAHSHLDRAIDSWIAFIETVNRIQNSGLWREKASTWREYVECVFASKLNYGYSRLRQLQAAQPIAAYLESESGIEPNERIVRHMRSLGYSEPEQALPIWVRSLALAQSLNQDVKPKHILAVHEVRTELQHTGGYVSIDGTQYDAQFVDVQQLAELQAAIEATKREQQHIADNSKRPVFFGRILPGGVLTLDEPQDLTNKRVKIIVLESAA